ncbi:MAG TPA: bifunctional 4-hydroxy-2-oxoglutarate aldolase/2-dehydro-3-deoxy-phosphogluconate aldolase [Puia sp.]|nr:bifunctional 4-hydroxy-2-oxoglutarate aldolase/2-dehydro-3-deoxy-phosphogluconate aldolase [Puia sp.]
MTALQKILDYKVVAILRGCDPGQIIEIARALSEGGVKLLEITLNSPDALGAIERVADQLGEELLVGAGTVLDGAAAEAAISAGAQFIISPTLDPTTIETTKRAGAISIPGAFTATEILEAYRLGADIIKVFPASIGPGYFRDLRGPLPHIPLMPTGGVNLENIREFQQAGAVAFGIGSALVNATEAVTADYLQQLREKAKKYIQALTHA